MNRREIYQALLDGETLSGLGVDEARLNESGYLVDENGLRYDWSFCHPENWSVLESISTDDLDHILEREQESYL